MRALAVAVRLMLFVPLLIFTQPASVRAQPPEVVTIEDAKSRLVAAVLQNTTWPDEEAIETFVVGVLGADTQLLAALRRDMTAARVRGRPVSVVRFDSLAAAAGSQILLLPREDNSRLAAIRGELEGIATLIFSDAADDRDNVMLNFTYPSENRVAFELVASRMMDAGLTPSRELLMFGGDKLDLVDVYEATEQRLEQARALAAEQQRRLADQSATIERQLQVIAANRRELEASESQLAGVQALLQDSVRQIGANARELKENARKLQENEQILAEREASIASYTRRIEENQQRLDAQQASILEQERRIAEQGSVLVTQLSTIESQRFFLTAIASVLFLVLLLIALTFRAYRSKHRIAVELEAKTGELEVANGKLLEMTEAKSLFLSTMSHEIRTPMNGVIGMAELLEGTSLTAQQNEYVALILKSADTLLGLINDILDFSKIEAGHLDLEAIPFSLREVLGDTLQTLALRADEKGLELTLRIPPEVPERLIGDPLRLRQVMVNLVGNAIKFTESGEVGVAIRLISKDDAVRLLFEVRDTGIGISPAQQQKIFEAFGQADSSTTRQFGGTGLGLSIAGQLVELMGGELAVRSEIGAGSTFFFTAAFTRPEEPEPVALHPEELRGLRALVVDDNETNRLILDELLANWGMEVRCVGDGREALRELDRPESRANPFAIALLDVMMPHLDGFELAALIRQRPELAAMRLLMLTSAGRTHTESLRRRLDISRVLLKPVKHSNLQQAVTNALGVTQEVSPGTAREDAGATVARLILLAEDNPVNRRVAIEVLGKRGHVIRVAANGREAVEATAQQAFDLLLMDVHMPVMDGLTATRIIREREHGSGSHTPIIALTAGATVQDRENCLSAGMDGFVSKPFRADDLIRAVEALATGNALTGTEMAVSVDSPPADEQPCLDWQSALRNLEGDEDFLCELGEMFLAQYPAMLTTITEAVDAQASSELQSAAHALKGSSQVIGGKAVAALALELESLGRAGKAVEAEPALKGLEHQLYELSAALRAELPSG